MLSWLKLLDLDIAIKSSSNLRQVFLKLILQ